mgnify:CR=1 FL=1
MVPDDDLFEFDGPREMPDNVEELLLAAAEREVEARTVHQLGRCHEFAEGPCQYCEAEQQG